MPKILDAAVLARWISGQFVSEWAVAIVWKFAHTILHDSYYIFKGLHEEITSGFQTHLIDINWMVLAW